jgi:hypothetical protein
LLRQVNCFPLGMFERPSLKTLLIAAAACVLLSPSLLDAQGRNRARPPAAAARLRATVGRYQATRTARSSPWWPPNSIRGPRERSGAPHRWFPRADGDPTQAQVAALAKRPTRRAGDMSLPLWTAAAILAAEYFLFSLAFDSAELRRRDDLWALAGYSGSLAAFVAAAVMGVCSGGAGQPPPPAPPPDRTTDRYLRACRLAAHAACLGLLWWLTSRVLSPSGPPAGSAAGWFAVWFAAAVATPLLAGAAAFPASATARCGRTARRCWAGL